VKTIWNYPQPVAMSPAPQILHVGRQVTEYLPRWLMLLLADHNDVCLFFFPCQCKHRDGLMFYLSIYLTTLTVAVIFSIGDV
jgi:hypothetical protein